MTDTEIIQALIRRDSKVTQHFFFRQCRPLFTSIIQRVLGPTANYDECINELYLYLIADNGRRLLNFQGRSSLFLWLKVVATRFFIEKSRTLALSGWCEPLYYGDTENSEAFSVPAPPENNIDIMDVENLLAAMPDRHYSTLLHRLIVEDAAPQQVAREMNITVDNLYNIKRRAMTQLMQVALKDIQQYEKR